MSTDVQARELLTVQEAAELLGVSTKQIRRLIERDEIVAVQLGGKGSPIRIPKRQLVDWLYSTPEADT